MRLFLITDDVEEFLIAASDVEDAYKVIEEQFSASAADELVCSNLREYPGDFFMTCYSLTAQQVAERGRRLVGWGTPQSGVSGGWRFPRPVPV